MYKPKPTPTTLVKIKRAKAGSLFVLAGVVGFGPTNVGVRVQCLTTWLYPKVMLFWLHQILYQSLCVFAINFNNSLCVKLSGFEKVKSPKYFGLIFYIVLKEILA